LEALALLPKNLTERSAALRRSGQGIVRSDRVSPSQNIADCQLPIVDLNQIGKKRLEIGNRKLAIGNI
jgi:hypothetical protein